MFIVRDVIEHFEIVSTSSTISRGGTSVTPLYLYTKLLSLYTDLASLSIVEVQQRPAFTVPCMMILGMFCRLVIPPGVLTATLAFSHPRASSFSLSSLQPASHKSLIHSWAHKESKHLTTSYILISHASSPPDYIEFIMAYRTNKLSLTFLPCVFSYLTPE